MYKHCETDDEYISLHDCHATNVTYEKGFLTFFFDDGIWILSNTLNKTVRTDRACVKFYLETGEESDVSIYVFAQKLKRTIRKEIKISKLLDSINNKKCTLEFLYQYKGYNSRVIDCWLWSDKKPFHKECQMKLRIEKVEYCWNNLCEDMSKSIGDVSDVLLLEKAKYKINMDVGCMIDSEWIESLKNGGIKTQYTNSRQEIVESFILYYKDFQPDY